MGCPVSSSLGERGRGRLVNVGDSGCPLSWTYQPKDQQISIPRLSCRDLDGTPEYELLNGIIVYSMVLLSLN